VRQAPQEPAFVARESLGGRDARTLARELPAMSQPELSAALEAALEAALDHDEPLVREHATWALAPLGARPRPAVDRAESR
jgi:hypothetical protein